DDPDSRARLRVTPEQAFNFPNYHCLASWIAAGSRIPSFMGQTYPWPTVGDDWERHHLDAMAERVGPYPDELASMLDRTAPPTDPADEPATDNATRDTVKNATQPKPAKARSRTKPTESAATPAARQPTITPARVPDAASINGKHEVQVDIEPAPP